MEKSSRAKTRKFNKFTKKEFDLVQIFKALWKRLWLVILVTVLAGALAFAGGKLFIKPTYRSSFTAYVNNRSMSAESTNTSTSDLNASISLTYLYQDIILSRSVLMDAAQLCQIEESYADIRSRVTTSVSEDSGLITVYVTDPDPVLACNLASMISSVAPGHVARMRDGSSMRILDAPVLPVEKHFPRDNISALIGLLLGLLFSSSAVIAADLIHDTVKNADDLEQRYQLAVIGTIPTIRATPNSGMHHETGGNPN